MRPAATLAEQAAVRELAVAVDGPHAGRWYYWRDDLEAMQRSAQRMDYRPERPAATFTRATSRPMSGSSIPLSPACTAAAGATASQRRHRGGC